jgi:hypothetical protein
MVVEYDRILMPLLMATFQFQNLYIVGLIKPLMVDNDNFIFGAMNSNEELLHGLLKIDYIYLS